jgi:hypothetical protein
VTSSALGDAAHKRVSPAAYPVNALMAAPMSLMAKQA